MSFSSKESQARPCPFNRDCELRNLTWSDQNPLNRAESHLELPIDSKAIRYGVATGQDAMGWTGRAYVGAMQEWPRWMPPNDMLERWPHLQPTADAGGLPGGPDNPLGSRALYLHYPDGRDSMYRIHGTNEPEKIGQGVSSGCIRMREIDAIDLYSRVKIGTKVVVM